MEGVGSRLGRASSRYGPSVTTAVFSGPVRKWKRKWVHVSSSPNTSQRNSSSSNGHRNGNACNTNSTSQLLLCRWTPLSSASPSVTTANSNPEDEDVGPPPKRKFRYTPVVVLEGRNKTAKKVETSSDAIEATQFTPWNLSNLTRDEPCKKDSQERQTTHFDLELSLKDNSSDLEPETEPDSKGGNFNPGGFWAPR